CKNFSPQGLFSVPFFIIIPFIEVLGRKFYKFLHLLLLNLMAMGYGNDSKNNPPHLKKLPILAVDFYYTLSCSFPYKADLETLVI
ncbi:hypothetical protein, partial [Bacillus mycoides]|uniref:hypothetical protein n=1 Tax=Bacillus mycoides TaxID=1405 RepID=UPI001C0BFEA1